METQAFESNSTNSSRSENWEREVLNRLAFATLNEQRRARRWGIFFKLLGAFYLGLLLLLVRPEWGTWLSEEEVIDGNKHSALVEIEGVIDTEGDASADKVVSGLRAALKDDKTAGVILRINSPGGSPVQAGYINDEINRLRDQHKDKKIPIYAVITDVCASGGYYIAVAADEIYADKASVVGSIGVLMNGFGFVGSMEKLGIERRLLTAGEHKGFLDPFSPTRSEDIEHIQQVLNNIHEQFISKVKKGREKSLKPKNKISLLENKKLFSGLIWTGEQAIALGLVDGLGSSSYVARELIKAEKIKDFTVRPDYLDRFAQQLGATLANTLSLVFSGTTVR